MKGISFDIFRNFCYFIPQKLNHEFHTTAPIVMRIQNAISLLSSSLLGGSQSHRKCRLGRIISERDLIPILEYHILAIGMLSSSLRFVPAPDFCEKMGHVHFLGAHLDHPRMFQHPPGRGAATGVFLEAVMQTLVSTVVF